MRFLIVVSLLVSSQRLLAVEPTVADTTKRSLAFLAKDALEWKKEYKCVSCHHAGMVVWALREAKQAGHAVDDKALTELAGWLAKAGDGSKLMTKRPEASP